MKRPILSRRKERGSRASYVRGNKKQDFMSKIMDHRRMGKQDGRKLTKNELFELKKGEKRSIIDYVERIEFPLMRLADAVKGLIVITSQCS